MRMAAKKVVPVIGPDLARVKASEEDLERWGVAKKVSGNGSNHSRLTMESYLTLRLAEEWSKTGKKPTITPGELPENPRFNDFVCLYLDRHGTREGVDQFYGRIAALFAKIQYVTDPAADLPSGSVLLPEALVKLAEITDFTVFLTTVGDLMLERAIKKVRPTTALLLSPPPVFSHERPVDLPLEAGSDETAVVYHLFGQFGVDARSFALTEDDLLDYVVSLQTRIPALGRLSDLLKNQLLLLGGGFPDWLARFVMRTAKAHLSDAEEILADEVAARDDSLCRFLQRFSPKTIVVPDGGAAFVSELHRQWKESRVDDQTGGRETLSVLPPVMPPQSAFISYASEDREFAERLRTKLKEAEVEVWYDQDQLESGDNWDAKIRQNVQRCVLFLPLVSRRTDRVIEGYFRTEWNAAAIRASGRSETDPFILPLLLDHDLRQEAIQRVPPQFRMPQWSRCGDNGLIPDSYIAEVKKAYDHLATHNPRRA
jgi:hypothetical protein